MAKNPFVLQVIRAGEVTDTEHARTFAEAMKMARVHLAPDVEVLILLNGIEHARMRQPQWRQVLHSHLSSRTIDNDGIHSDNETEVR